MGNKFLRTKLIFGKDAIEKLKRVRVAVFGVGGVGSFVVEGLIRAGIGSIILVDKDIVDVTNINRQLIATTKTIGEDKVEVEKRRILEINPEVEVKIYKEFFMPNIEENIIDSSIDYIIDAIDTVTAKIELIRQARELNIPIISCMGTGNKIDPTKLEVTDIYETSVCPLAKVMRKELKKRNVEKLKVVYSKEEPLTPKYEENDIKILNNKQIPGSVSFVPSVAGLIIAGEVIKDLIR